MSEFAPRSAVITDATHGRRLATLPLLLLVAGFAVLLTGVGAVRPAPALALSTFATKCDGVALRSRPYTSATNLATLSKGIKVVAVDKVAGGSWRTACAGTTATGSSWYKITVANGKDVRTRFGLSYVYGASSLFAKLYSMSYKQTSCDGVNVRARASTDATKKATLPAGTKVTVIGTVSGGSWGATCSGNDVSGSTWYKIDQVNGKSTSSLYGVAAVYGAEGLFASLSSDAPTATPTPAPAPSPFGSRRSRALLAALADNAVGEIVVANGTYHVSPSDQTAADSLWIGGDRFARPHPADQRPRRDRRRRDVRRRRQRRLRRPELRGRRPRPDLGRLPLRQHGARATPGSSRSAATCRAGRRTTSRSAT